MATTGVPALDQILGSGYPTGSSILIVGQAGIGKEALGYSFVRAGLSEGDFCLYVTHRRVADVKTDMKGFGFEPDGDPEWVAGAGSAARCDLRDITSMSFVIKKAVEENASRRVRVVTDVLSPLLVLNPPESMYDYWAQLISGLKQHDATLLAFAEKGMHMRTAIASMEQLFDGVIEMKVYEDGMRLTPILRVKKMLGVPPVQNYFTFSFKNAKMEIAPNVV